MDGQDNRIHWVAILPIPSYEFIVDCILFGIWYAYVANVDPD